MKKKRKWKSLAHNGVCFPPDYEPMGFRLRIRGEAVELTPFQEEMAMAWAKKIGTPYVEDPVFRKNFLADFLKLFPPELKDVRIEDLDFAEFTGHLLREKEKYQDKEKRKQRAADRKELREKLKAKFGQARIDGAEVDVANYMVEPPGIFMGRGEHPFRGKWKPRIHPGDVVLNLSKDSDVPDGDWKKIVHDRDSMWLARWVDKLTDKEKYVWLHDSAGVRQERDKAKYEKAKYLGVHIRRVVKKIYKALRARKQKQRMVATAAYLIAKLAMRVGDEKDADEADTVGASTLRVEHIRIEGDQLIFDFLGKDSVRWQQVCVMEGEDRKVLENIREFMRGKSPQDPVFSDINSRTVNAFLGSLLEGLSAKVFRTFLATRAVTDYLAHVKRGVAAGSPFQKLFHAKLANLEAAKLCNHKRAIPKNFEERLEKRREKLDELKKKRGKTEKQKQRLKERREKMKMQLELAQRTRDYNLGTSLRNYIDPRICKSWCDHVGLEWTKLYTKALQRKFQWVARSAPRWKTVLASRKASVPHVFLPE
jgi:DNA topoisomerase-1